MPDNLHFREVNSDIFGPFCLFEIGYKFFFFFYGHDLRSLLPFTRSTYISNFIPFDLSLTYFTRFIPFISSIKCLGNIVLYLIFLCSCLGTKQWGLIPDTNIPAGFFFNFFLFALKGTYTMVGIYRYIQVFWR